MMADHRFRQEALKIVFRRKSAAEDQASLRRETFLQQHPDFLQLERGISASAVAGMRAGLAGAGPEEIQKYRDENLALQEKRKAYLEKCGLKPDCFEPVYHCALCQDTGRQQGKICVCVKELERKMLYERLNAQTPLQLSDFSCFSLDYYPLEALDNGLIPRERMKKIYQYCVDYAAHFSKHADSILMTGATGLGKTHLSLAIAKAVTEQGFFVLYGSAQNFLNAMERERFGRSEGDTAQELIDCDLLVLDDLGAEFPSPFVLAAIYNIVNTRLMRECPTIISTNLSLSELEQRYGERVVSRLMGCYEVKQFVGRDVRVAKKMRSAAKSEK